MTAQWSSSSVRSGPLAGRGIVVTRSRHQSAELNELLRAHGAEPIPYPCIAIAPPISSEPVDAALRAAAEHRFDWLILTSANAVLALQRRMTAVGQEPGSINRIRVAAVGSRTAEAARRLLGLHVQVVPEEAIGKALAARLEHVVADANVLLPQADVADPLLSHALAAAGARVTSVAAYRTVCGHGGVRLRPLLAAGCVDAVTLASASAARHLVARLDAEGAGVRDLARTHIACIGSSTAAAARDAGLPTPVMASQPTPAALVAALESALTDKRDSRRSR